MKVPRAAYIRFPIGNPCGEAFKPEQQKTIVKTVLSLLEDLQEPGLVVELPFRWRRM